MEVPSWFDPIEDGLRAKVRGFIEMLIEEELTTALSRPRYGRRPAVQEGGDATAPVTGHRHGRRTRRLTGTFGPTAIAVPRARIVGPDGTTSEWKSAGLRAYQRRTRAADALRDRRPDLEEGGAYERPEIPFADVQEVRFRA